MMMMIIIIAAVEVVAEWRRATWVVWHSSAVCAAPALCDLENL